MGWPLDWASFTTLLATALVCAAALAVLAAAVRPE